MAAAHTGIRLERLLGRDRTRLTVHGVTFELTRPELVRLGEETLRVLASVARDQETPP